MNRLLLRLFLIYIVSFAIGPVYGESEVIHTVEFPSGDAAWSVAFQYATAGGQSSVKTVSSASTPPRWKLKKIDIVRVGNTRRDTMHWANGYISECWWPSGSNFVLSQDDPNGKISAAKLGHVEDRRFDASTFAWVGKSNFMGMQSLNGKLCRYYRTEVEIFDGEKEFIYAWIDDKSSKPVAWNRGGCTAFFSFEQAIPTEALVMPENFNKELKRINAFFAPPKLEP